MGAISLGRISKRAFLRNIMTFENRFIWLTIVMWAFKAPDTEYI